MTTLKAMWLVRAGSRPGVPEETYTRRFGYNLNEFLVDGQIPDGNVTVQAWDRIRSYQGPDIIIFNERQAEVYSYVRHLEKLAEVKWVQVDFAEF